MQDFFTIEKNAQLSKWAYKNWTQEDADGSYAVAYKDANGDNWEVYAVSGDEGKDTGYYSVAYTNERTKEVVVAYRGTDDIKDTASDIQIALGQNLPNQYVVKWGLKWGRATITI